MDRILPGLHLQCFINPDADEIKPYGPAQYAILGGDAFTKAWSEIVRWPGYAKTPLQALNQLAAATGLGQIYYKDEASRFGLGSFKALGGAYAVSQLLIREIAALTGEQNITATDLLSGRFADLTSSICVTCATDGNHGRSVAWGAQRFGCQCVIYVHARVSQERADAIARFGAKILRTSGNYDDSVKQAAEDAARLGRFVVSDTSYPGYMDVPKDVMQGYAVMADEALQQFTDMSGQLPTHVFLQGGVGGLAAAVVGHFWEKLEKRNEPLPRFIVVEPDKAACLYESARAGKAVAVHGDLDTVMAGLACGEISLLAWEILRESAFAFLTINDEVACETMRILAYGRFKDKPIVAGESAVAGLAACLGAAADQNMREKLGLNEKSRILVFGSEGATDPDLYEEIVGDSAKTISKNAENFTLEHNKNQGLRINLPRLMSRIHALAQVGKIEGGGNCRLALTKEDAEGRRLVMHWMSELGLQISVDAIGNVIGIRAGLEEGAPVMTGSHIDTVRTGGRYDGNLGVLAGLEVIATLNDAGITTRRPLAVGFFTNEEGVRFSPDMMGSLVYVGGMSVDKALDIVGIDGTTVGDNLKQIGFNGEISAQPPDTHVFVELHIEQGPVLEHTATDIGAVTGVQAIHWTEFTVEGVSNHAGTTPMHLRHDAGYAAYAIADFARRVTHDLGGGQLATIGQITLSPNLINVIPNRAVFTVDLRNTDDKVLAEAVRRIFEKSEEIANLEGVSISHRSLANFGSVKFDEKIVSRIEALARENGLSVRRMDSGAGHDAQMFARICPAGMIFIPSVNGLSHNIAEFSREIDIDAGANILLAMMREFAD